MTPGERLIVAGAIVVAAGLLLPWYGIPFSRGLSVTAIDRFGFAHVALLLTVAAAVFVAAGVAAGRPAPVPFQPWALVAAAGVWAALLVGFLMVARPEELAGSTDVGLRLGPFVSLGGCLAIVAGGLRMREEAART